MGIQSYNAESLIIQAVTWAACEKIGLKFWNIYQGFEISEEKSIEASANGNMHWNHQGHLQYSTVQQRSQGVYIPSKKEFLLIFHSLAIFVDGNLPDDQHLQTIIS